MLRLIKYLIILTVLFAIALPIVAVVSGLQQEPLVPVQGKPAPGDIARA